MTRSYIDQPNHWLARLARAASVARSASSGPWRGPSGPSPHPSPASWPIGRRSASSGELGHGRGFPTELANQRLERTGSAWCIVRGPKAAEWPPPLSRNPLDRLGDALTHGRSHHDPLATPAGQQALPARGHPSPLSPAAPTAGRTRYAPNPALATESAGLTGGFSGRARSRAWCGTQPRRR